MLHRISHAAGQAWRLAEDTLARPRGLALLFVVALAAYAVGSVAWPLAPGRDMNLYLSYWLELRYAHPVYPALMLFVMPAAPVFLGGLLELGGPDLVEAVLGLAYAGSIVAYAAVARMLSPRLGVATAAALLAMPSYNALFHTLSSDAPFALGFALWALLFARTVVRPTLSRVALNGLAVFLLVLIRPSSQLLLLFAFVPLALAWPLRRRLLAVAAFGAVTVALLCAWATYNLVRFDDLTVARTSAAQAPFYHVFVYDRLISPENGPASRQLADAVRQELLSREPYRSYGIDEHRFFTSGSSRMWSDLVVLSDRRWGWDSHYGKLRAAALEAVRRHPVGWLRGLVGTVRIELRETYAPPASSRARPTVAPHGTVVVARRRLPAPGGGEPIPASRLDWLASTPDGSIHPDWSSLADPRLRFATPSAARQAHTVETRLARYDRKLPARTGSNAVAHRLDGLARVYPSPLLLLLAGLVAAAIRRGRGLFLPSLLCAFALVLLVATAVAQPPKVEYRVPLDPLFVLFALAALLGTQRATRRRSRVLGDHR